MNNEQLTELDRLITEVSNTSHRCGAHDINADEEGYDRLLDKAYAAESALRNFVIEVEKQGRQ